MLVGRADLRAVVVVGWEERTLSHAVTGEACVLRLSLLLSKKTWACVRRSEGMMMVYWLRSQAQVP